MDVVCTVCGGTDYSLECGFYFCNECQTQTQERREEVLEYNETADFSRLEKTTLKKKTSNTENKEKITSWEGFNYILLGLVEEMICLGARPELKLVVLQIWASYLSKIEIAFTSKYSQKLPKLSAAYKNNDVEIIYNRKKVRKRKRCTSSGSSSFTLPETHEYSASDKIQVKKSKTKRRGSLLKAEFDSSRTSKVDTNSTLNQSLSSLESSSNASVLGSVKQLKLSRAAYRERLKTLTRKHLKTHCKDAFDDLSCHKFTTKTVTSGYISSPHHLTKLKLFSILYLGVLQIGEKIHLGDMLRFCREGHLSYVSYDHFFPEQVLMNIDYKKIFKGGNQCVPKHYEVRKCAAKIAKLIGMKSIETPDLLELCKRYLKELVLPRQLMCFIEDIFLKYPPEMQFLSTKCNIIPNYEGRAMAYIIFALKYLFGLNGFSENIASEAAKQLNKLKIPRDDQHTVEDPYNLLPSDSSLIESDKKYSHKYFFVWTDWIKYIECRKSIVRNKHYPTAFYLDCENTLRTKEFIDFLKKNKSKLDNEETNKTNIHDQIFKSVFLKVSSEQTLFTDDACYFNATLTPFYSYLNEIVENYSNTQDIPKLILNNNFTESDINFLINVSDITNLINLKKLKKMGKIKVSKHTVKMFHYDIRTEKYKINRMNKLIPIQFSSRTASNVDFESDDSILEFDETKLNSFETVNIINNPLNNETNVVTKNNVFKNESDTVIDHDQTQAAYESVASEEKINFENISQDEPFQCGQTEKQKPLNKHIKLESNPVNTSGGNLLLFPQNNYWLYHGDITMLTNGIYDKIENRLPNSFAWLLNNCSETVENPAKDLYCELVCIEVCLGFVEKPAELFFAEEENHKNIKALYKLIANCKKLW